MKRVLIWHPFLFLRFMQFTFKKHERLCNENIIEELFKNGKSINVSPLRLVYLPYAFADNIAGQMMIVAPKRKLKKAVDRNRVKRIIREAYRLQKHKIYAIENRKFAMSLSFIGQEPITLESAENALAKIIEKLILRELKN